MDVLGYGWPTPGPGSREGRAAHAAPALPLPGSQTCVRRTGVHPPSHQQRWRRAVPRFYLAGMALVYIFRCGTTVVPTSHQWIFLRCHRTTDLSRPEGPETLRLRHSLDRHRELHDQGEGRPGPNAGGSTVMPVHTFFYMFCAADTRERDHLGRGSLRTHINTSPSCSSWVKLLHGALGKAR